MSLSTLRAAGKGQTSAPVEREAELKRLQRCAEQVDLSGEGLVTLIGGEAGVGKTTLVNELCRRGGPGQRVLAEYEPLLAPRPFGPVHRLG